jgi:hypothetical protein
MKLWFDTVFLAVFNAKLGCGTAINLFTVLCVTGLALLGL